MMGPMFRQQVMSTLMLTCMMTTGIPNPTMTTSFLIHSIVSIDGAMQGQTFERKPFLFSKSLGFLSRHVDTGLSFWPVIWLRVESCE